MTVQLLLVALTLPLLLYLPGWMLSRAVSGACPVDRLERHFERMLVSTLFSGWLALTLATLGIFTLALQLAITLALCAGLWWRARARPPTPPPAGRRWETAAFLLAALVVLLPLLRPFEVVLGARDAGTYANTGFAMARSGSLVQHDELVAGLGQAALSADPAVRGPAEQAMSNFLGVQNRERYIATRLRAAGFFINDGEAPLGRVVPQGLHLFPVWIGLLAASGGMYLGLFAPGLMAALGAFSVGMLGRRLAGPGVGLLAMLFLGLNGVQVWFGRYSTAETTAQFLIFAGLYFFAKFQQPPSPDRLPTATPINSRYYAALAGIAFGQLALTRIDFILVVPLVLAYLGYCALSRNWQGGQTALSIGLGAMLLHAALHITFIARAYFFDTAFFRLQDYAVVAYLVLPFLTPILQEIYAETKDPAKLLRELAALAGLAGLLLVAWLRPQPLQWLSRQLVRARGPLLAISAAGLLLLAGYAYLVRPQIIDSDILFNMRAGWSDPLTRDPQLVRADVNAWRMTPALAREQAGVVLVGDQYWAATAVDATATAQLRAELLAARGPWQGPFSNHTFNWLRLQGYVGAPIALPRVLYATETEWWRDFLPEEEVPPGVTPPPGIPVKDKYTVPLANLVRVGWYLSPLGIALGVAGFCLWWWRGMNRASWLFLAAALAMTYFYVRQTHGTSDQHYIYILRRFVPITYPAFSLAMAYALAALAGWGRPRPASGLPMLRPLGAAGFVAATTQQRLWPTRTLAAGLLAAALLLFFGWTNRPIFGHVEYGGAVRQLSAIAQDFAPGDVLLFRGGEPTYGQSRDVPDLVATPLTYVFGLNALTVKSTQPGAYADALAEQVRHWQAAGRTVYVAYSASGADFALPGFALAPHGSYRIDLAEFEQLTNQKPRNVAALRLPFAVYELVPQPAGDLATVAPPLSATDFAAQVRGFYRPESGVATPFAWTDGAALLRLPWNAAQPPQTVTITVAGGRRPAHLGPAELCVSLQGEPAPWPAAAGASLPLGCVTLTEEMTSYTLPLPTTGLPPAPLGSMLLSLQSENWVPAVEDPRQNDGRAIGVQFAGVAVE